jgi:hypothetical protein
MTGPGSTTSIQQSTSTARLSSSLSVVERVLDMEVHARLDSRQAAAISSWSIHASVQEYSFGGLLGYPLRCRQLSTIVALKESEYDGTKEAKSCRSLHFE